MTPRSHQLKFSEKLWELLKTKGYAYLAGKPRSGKTYTAILCAEKSDKIDSVLVLTKKTAIKGWHKFTENNPSLNHTYYVTNYEQAHKLNPKDYDLVIIDESHNLGVLGKPTKRFLTLRKLCWDMPHIHLSGTAIVESQCGIYHQMAISKYNPFKEFKSFYRFHDKHGEKYYIKAAGRDIAQYDRANDTLLPKINEFTIYMTQEDAGISAELQARDVVHYVELSAKTKELYNTIQRDKVKELAAGTLVCDSVMKERTSLHMIESGIAKIDNDYIELGNTEKIDYIKKTFGDTEDVGIMSHFIGERKLLTKHFERAKIYSSNSHAEGVDLSHLKHFIIISSDYSGAKFIQRRDRIVNMDGSNTLDVNHIVVKKAISEQVYRKVSKKEDFNNSTYERNSL